MNTRLTQTEESIARLPALMFTILFAHALSAQERALSPIEKLGEDGDGAVLALPAPQPDQMKTTERDGVWTLAVRLSSPGAEGMQFFLENLRLPVGAQLALRPLDATGEPGPAAAVYTFSGPLQGDPFWTAAVPGADALLEVTFGGESVGDLPFQLTRLRQLSVAGLERAAAPAAAEPLGRPELEGLQGFARFRGAIVPYEVRNGQAIFEGDIVLGNIGEIETVSAKEARNQRQSQGITNTYYRWPGGVVPYEIDPTLPSQNRITDAIAHWNTQLGGTIKLQPRNGEAFYVRFVNTTSPGTCSSYIGNIHAAGQAITFGAYCSTGNAIHEIGHAIGLYHEHTREDRNTFVRINTDNITASAIGNFNQAITASDDLGAYDYGSIMHYGAYAFSSNGLMTIETIPAGIAIGQRNGLSAGDIAGVRIMYPTTPVTTTTAVTVASNPAGRQLVVDGVPVTAPATFQWLAGSTHTVSAPTATSGATRYLFRTWSDGGAQSHSVSTPTSPLTLTANFQTQYTVSAVSSNATLGTVARSPASADSFYNAGSSLSVSATAAASACFTGWTGITAPPSTPLQLTVNTPYAITGNFQQASITAAPSVITVASAGGSGSIAVTATSGCAWTARSNASWITITSGASAVGSGTLNYTVARRNGNRSRTGTITIGRATVTINQ
jgi:astacin